ncbi:MAG: hypothetical protein IKP20_06000 [Candidatus Methanomethylophilaceae archaeon]|jgi:hypothetical protein|nr:hypothetical protein [Candidatus Methanomethylophilaceae archaeon]
MRDATDAYLIREDAERLASAIGKEGATEEAVLRSHSHGNRPIIASYIDGRSVIDIVRDDSGNKDPLLSMETRCASLSEEAVIFYGVGGRRIKLKIFDGIQEDMSNPKIFGVEFDARNFGRWLKKKLGKRQEPD